MGPQKWQNESGEGPVGVIMLVSEVFGRFEILKTHVGERNFLNHLGPGIVFHTLCFLKAPFLPCGPVSGGDFLLVLSQDGLGNAAVTTCRFQ